MHVFNVIEGWSFPLTESAGVLFAGGCLIGTALVLRRLLRRHETRENE